MLQTADDRLHNLTIFLVSAARIADDGDPCVSLAELSVDDFEKFLLVAPAVDVEDENVDFFTIFLASATRVADDGDPCVSLAELCVDNFEKFLLVAPHQLTSRTMLISACTLYFISLSTTDPPQVTAR